MKRFFGIATCCSLLLSAPAGCHSAPGWRVGWEIYQPPTLTAATPLTAVAAAPLPPVVIQETAPPVRMRSTIVAAPSAQADCAPCPEPLPVPGRKMPTGTPTNP